MHLYILMHICYVTADEDASRREAVRKKTGGYLRHAEKLYNQHLANKVLFYKSITPSMFLLYVCVTCVLWECFNEATVNVFIVCFRSHQNLTILLTLR